MLRSWRNPFAFLAWGLAACQSLDITVLPDASTAHDAGKRDAADGSRGKDAGRDGREPLEDGPIGDAGCGSDGATCQDAAFVCPQGLQTSFQVMVQGDSNPGFTSGVATRTANRIILFTSLATGDAGAGNEIYAQAFDLDGVKEGPAAPLYSPDAGTGLFLHDVATAPGGGIVLLYGYGGRFEYGSTISASQEKNLHALFLRSGGSGALGLSYVSNYPLETSATIYGQAHAIWDEAIGGFVISWEWPDGFADEAQEYSVHVTALDPSGSTIGFGAPAAPTDDSSWVSPGPIEQANVGAMGQRFVTPYFGLESGFPEVSVATGDMPTQFTPVVIVPTQVYGHWIAAAGTSRGAVCLYDDLSQGLPVAFVPIAPDGGVAGSPSLKSMSTTRAKGGRAVSDNADGGVGAALLYEDGLYFGYVGPGGQPLTPSSPMGSQPGDAGAFDFNIASLQGSFVIALYNGPAHAVTAAVSGCTPP
jgi:hypothetical protein